MSVVTKGNRQLKETRVIANRFDHNGVFRCSRWKCRYVWFIIITIIFIVFILHRKVLTSQRLTNFPNPPPISAVNRQASVYTSNASVTMLQKRHHFSPFLISATVAALVITPLVSADIWKLDLGSQDLDGTWKARNLNGSITVPATVPGGIYTDLETAEILETPVYYRFNDQNYRWVSKEDWIYTRTFQIGVIPLAKKRVVIVCDGIDTVSNITINDRIIGSSNNMFIRYIFDIKSAIQKGDNNLSFLFDSPVTYAAKQYEEQLIDYIVPPECVPPVQRGECHANFIRKMQASFSWDWGPAFPSMGIWKSISLEAFDSAILRDVTVTSTPRSLGTNGTWQIKIDSFFDIASNMAEEGLLNITLLAKTGLIVLYLENVTLTPDSQNKAKYTATATANEGVDFDLWWPNGYGQQPLYNFTVTFTSHHVKETTSKEIRIGFRTIKLIQDPVANNTGLTFYFRVNDVPVFMKGSNWIPAHVLPEKVTSSYLQDLLHSAAEAHMNMLRVWGGGIYELLAFYQYADEYGILIWHDLMFACSMYQRTPEFLNISAEEVQTQVLRLQHHPSIAIWAGNNENEAALRENWYGTQQNFDTYKSDYISLYVNTLKPIVESLDPERPFVTSSPSNGLVTIAEGYVAVNPQSTLVGDVHYYNYYSDGWQWTTFPRPRFASEFGFQSWPSFETLAKVTIPEDWKYFSQFMFNRQHHLAGNVEIISQVQRHFDVPHVETEDGYKAMLYLGQLNQAMSIKTEAEFYRRCKSELQENGEGLTMGSLYWQLNDIWQGASWASIEFGGKWKVLHYYATQFYAPVLVSPYLDNDQLNVYVVTDLQEDISGFVQISVYEWASLEPLHQIQVSFQETALVAHSVYQSSLSGLLEISVCNVSSNCFLHFSISNNQNNSLGPDNFLFLGKKINVAAGVQPANIQITNVSAAFNIPYYATAFHVTITTDYPAPFVWLEAVGIEGRFEDNGFLLVQAERSVAFYCKQNVSKNVFEDSLSVKSLLDFYSTTDEETYRIRTNSLG